MNRSLQIGSFISNSMTVIAKNKYDQYENIFITLSIRKTQLHEHVIIIKKNNTQT